MLGKVDFEWDQKKIIVLVHSVRANHVTRLNS